MKQLKQEQSYEQQGESDRVASPRAVYGRIETDLKSTDYLTHSKMWRGSSNCPANNKIAFAAKDYLSK